MQTDETVLPDEIAPGTLVPVIHPPQAPRVEATDQQIALRDQHTFCFAQNLVRIGEKFKRVWQHQQVDRLTGKRQTCRIGEQVRAYRNVKTIAVLDPARAQQIDIAQPDLHRIEAEQVGRHGIKDDLLTTAQVFPVSAGKPFCKRTVTVGHAIIAPMDTEIHVSPIPAFRDNYIWAIHNRHQAALVDPGDAAPVRAFLERNGLTPCAILNTHHHHDHIGGNAELVAQYGIDVYGPADEDIPSMNRPVREGDTVTLDALGIRLQVIDVPGHTAGHIAWHAPEQHLLFSGDTLFGCGCGRLFEGSAEQMYHSLEKLARLPGATRVFCAHEYTLSNIAFALTVEPDNAALQARARADREHVARHQPTLPSTLDTELATNPFLRCHLPQLRRHAEFSSGRMVDSATEVFSILRSLKNEFR